MRVVIICFFIFALLVISVMYFLIKFIDQKDKKIRAIIKQRVAQQKKTAEEELEVYKENKILVCLSCDNTFLSPLSSSGCPSCYLSTLVITKDRSDSLRRELEKEIK